MAEYISPWKKENQTHSLFFIFLLGKDPDWEEMGTWVRGLEPRFFCQREKESKDNTVASLCL